MKPICGLLVPNGGSVGRGMLVLDSWDEIARFAMRELTGEHALFVVDVPLSFKGFVQQLLGAEPTVLGCETIMHLSSPWIEMG